MGKLFSFIAGFGFGTTMVLTITWKLYPTAVPNPAAIIPLAIVTIMVATAALVL